MTEDFILIQEIETISTPIEGTYCDGWCYDCDGGCEEY
jgi:hypothetical protein